MQDLVVRAIGGRGSNKLLLLLSTTFGALGLLLSVSGIFGVVSHAVTRRTQEIGVRVSLGATQTDILFLVLKETFATVFAGLLLGVTGSIGAGRLLSSYLFHVRPLDAVTLTMSASALAAVGLLGAYVPARRASKIDPMAALRCE